MEDIFDNDLIQFANNNLSIKRGYNTVIINNFLKNKQFHITWHIFHSFSVMYPDNPTEEEQIKTKIFINKITTNLFLMCSSCSKNKDKFIENSNVDFAVSSKTNLIQFFCDYHKTINTQINTNYKSDIYTIEFIINRYTQNDYISLIDTLYNINLLKLFQQNKMDYFFQIFNTNIRKIYLELNNYEFEFNFTRTAK